MNRKQQTALLLLLLLIRQRRGSHLRKKKRRRRLLQNHIEHVRAGSQYKQNGHGFAKIRAPPSKRRKLEDSSDSTETSSESSDESSDDSSLFTPTDSFDDSSHSESDISSIFDINNDNHNDENKSNEINQNADEDGMICMVKSEPHDDPLANTATDDQDIKPDINELNKSLNRQRSTNYIKLEHESPI